MCHLSLIFAAFGCSCPTVGTMTLKFSQREAYLLPNVLYMISVGRTNSRRDRTQLSFVLTFHGLFIPQVGDGTTSVVLLAGEILKNCKPFIEENVHPQIIVRGVRKATQLSMQKIKEIAVHVKREDPE